MLSKAKQAGRYSGKRGKANKTPESYIQSFAEDYCALRGLFCFHVPDWLFGYVNNPVTRTPKALTLAINKHFKGLPDCIIMKPIEGTKWCKTLCLEIKTKTQLHGVQVQNAYDQNWQIARSVEEVQKIIEEFIRE